MKEGEAPNYLQKYWERVLQDAEKQVEVAKKELAKIALRMQERENGND